MIELPKWCACGNIVTFSNEDRCEQCYASDQERWHGKNQLVDTFRPIEIPKTKSPLARNNDAGGNASQQGLRAR